MVPDAVAAIQERLRAVPWDVPIAVHFACDDRPLYGCRVCILRFGLRTGDRSHLFGSEEEALAHIATHGNATDRRPARPDYAGRVARQADKRSYG